MAPCSTSTPGGESRRARGAASQGRGRPCNESVQWASLPFSFLHDVMTATGLSETELARFNMIEQQIRPWQVQDHRVLQALLDVRRERFAPSRLQALAFSDVE